MAGGKEQIVKPELYQELVYAINFYNKSNIVYIPVVLVLLNEFEYDLVREDGVSIDLDEDIYVDWDYESLDENAPVQIMLTIYSLEKAYGKLILTVRHLKTNQQIQKVINVYTEAPSPSVKPSIKKSTLKLSHSKATLYTVGSKTIKIRATIVGPSNKVIYRSSNSKIARVDRNGKVTAIKGV